MNQRKWIALTRSVSPTIQQCALTHLDRSPIDFSRAQDEHAKYESVLRSLGADVIRLPDLPENPDAVFVEDTAVVLDRVAILARPGAESRRAEVASVASTLSTYRDLKTIETPGTLDGGDVLRVGNRLFVGRSSRTNEVAIRALVEIASAEGYQVTPVEVRGCLHLKSAVTALDESTVVLQARWIDRASFQDYRIVEPDPSELFAANVLSFDGSVIVSNAFPATKSRIEDAGYETVEVPQSELAKAEGAVTCGCILINTAIDRAPS